MNGNSQFRMTNDEIRRNTEIRMTKPPIALLRVLRHSSFGFLSSFVIRHSSFDNLCEPGSRPQCMRKSEPVLSPILLAISLLAFIAPCRAQNLAGDEALSKVLVDGEGWQLVAEG